MVMRIAAKETVIRRGIKRHWEYMLIHGFVAVRNGSGFHYESLSRPGDQVNDHEGALT